VLTDLIECVSMCAGCIALHIITECCCTSDSSLAGTFPVYWWVFCHFSTVQHCVVFVHSVIQRPHSLDLQVLAQPWFAFVENAVYRRFGETHFTHTEFIVSIRGVPWLRLTLFRLVWRTAYVCFTTCEFCWFLTAGVYDGLLAQQLFISCMPGWYFRFDITTSSVAGNQHKIAARQYAHCRTTAAGSGLTGTCLIRSMCLLHEIAFVEWPCIRSKAAVT